MFTKYSTSSKLELILFCLCILLGSLLTGCSDPENSSSKNPNDAATSTKTAKPQGPLRPNFHEVSQAAGLNMQFLHGSETADHIIDSLGSGVGWIDVDGDGDWDLYAAQGASRTQPTGPPDRLFINEGDMDGDGVPNFTDATEAWNLGDTRWSFGVAVADYDNDGDDDLYLTNWGPNRLYRNDGDRFVDVGPASGTADPGLSTAAAWGDSDGDGDLDLFITNYVEFDFERYPTRGEAREGWSGACAWRGIEVFCGPRNLQGANDRLFRNDGDPDGDGIPNFTDISKEAGVMGERAYGLAALWFDAEPDGDQDLYVANDSVANGFFRNRGDGTFDNEALVAGLAFNEEGHEQAGMGISAGDIDRDQKIDLAVSNFSHDHDTVYRNEGNGFFMDESYNTGIGTFSYLTLGWGLRFGDFDHDGWDDLLVMHGHVYPQVDGQDVGTTFAQKNELFWNRGEGKFLPLGADAGPALTEVRSFRSVATADVDADGDLDFAIVDWNGGLQLWQNQASLPTPLQIRLHSSQNTLGTKVYARCGKTTLYQELRRQSGYLSSDAPELHFGLPCESWDAVEVQWPDGSKTVREQLKPGLVTIQHSNE